MVIRRAGGCSEPTPRSRHATVLFAAFAALLTVLAAAAFSPPAHAALGVPARAADPVVLEGADVPDLIGARPELIVAFSWDGGWKQIPVQVDERALVDYKKVRQGTYGGREFSQEAYVDAGTYAGADPNPRLDAGDEIALMAKDAGTTARASVDPPGVFSGSRTKLAITDPLNSSSRRFVYLFRTSAGLDPAAGKSYVDYDFDLLSGDYKGTYDFGGVADNGNGPPANLEDSTVHTDFYSQHLLSRWVQDRLQIKAGSATGVDVLDGDKAQVNYGCGRSELTFSRGGGGFVVNKSGPVRAIRSYIGANSGIYTQRDHVFYERRDDSIIYLRVHPGISTISTFLDYSPAAAGMAYRNSANPAGATIDGIPDPELDAGEDVPVTWEQASGPQGTISLISRIDTTIPGSDLGTYYLDDSTSPSVEQCGGYADDEAWSSSGPVITDAGQNTDPTLGEPVYALTGTRSNFYDAPGAEASLAALRSRQIDAPLRVALSNAPDQADPAVLQVAAKGPGKRVRAGRRARLEVRVRNIGAGGSGTVKVCPKANRRLVRTPPCKRIKRGIGSEKSVKRGFRVKLRRAAGNQHRVKVHFRVSSATSSPTTTIDLRVRRR